MWLCVFEKRSYTLVSVFVCEYMFVCSKRVCAGVWVKKIIPTYVKCVLRKYVSVRNNIQFDETIFVNLIGAS